MKWGRDYPYKYDMLFLRIQLCILVGKKVGINTYDNLHFRYGMGILKISVVVCLSYKPHLTQMPERGEGGTK